MWIFGFLFEVENVEEMLINTLNDRLKGYSATRKKDFDLAIDRDFGVIEVAGQSYYASEILFAVDNVAYSEVGMLLCGEGALVEGEYVEAEI